MTPHVPLHDRSTAAVVAPAIAMSARRVSWPAVFAGAVLALAVQVLLSMLGTGIGLSTLAPLGTGDSPAASSFGYGAAAWWIVSSLLALFVGGWVAGRLSGMLRSGDGSLHGLLTWGLAVLATIYLLGSAASSLISGASGILGSAVSATATVSAAAAPKVAEAAGEQLNKAGISVDSIKRDAMQLLGQTGKPGLQPDVIAKQADGAVADAKQAATNGVTSDADFTALIERLLTRGKEAASQVDRDALINVVMARTGLSRDNAAKRVAGWEATADQARVKAAQAADEAKQKAREVADATARNVSRAMLFAFLALAVGGLAACWGGAVGQRRGALAI